MAARLTRSKPIPSQEIKGNLVTGSGIVVKREGMAGVWLNDDFNDSGIRVCFRQSLRVCLRYSLAVTATDVEIELG